MFRRMHEECGLLSSRCASIDVSYLLKVRLLGVIEGVARTLC